MERDLYVMLMESRRQLEMGVIQRHVEHLKELDAAGKLFLCGPFREEGGGMVILKVPSYEQADTLAKADPYIAEGYKTYQLKTLQVAEKENGYLLD